MQVLEDTVTAGVYLVGLDSNVAGDEAAAFKAKPCEGGFTLGDRPEAEQVTVAKQRTMFQTQARSFADTEWAHGTVVSTCYCDSVRYHNEKLKSVSLIETDGDHQIDFRSIFMKIISLLSKRMISR